MQLSQDEDVEVDTRQKELRTSKRGDQVSLASLQLNSDHFSHSLISLEWVETGAGLPPVVSL